MGVFVLVVLLLVIMPALLYLIGWVAQRYVGQTPLWINFAPPPKLPSKTTDGETPARPEA